MEEEVTKQTDKGIAYLGHALLLRREELHSNYTLCTCHATVGTGRDDEISNGVAAQRTLRIGGLILG